MDLTKQYIIQSLTAASNNLRLTTHQLEAVGLLRETFLNSDDLRGDIEKMKSITELSTLAVRLNDIYSYLSHNKIDFFKLSERFKQHSQYLISDLSHLLEVSNPGLIKSALFKLKGKSPINELDEISVDLKEDKTESNQLLTKEIEITDDDIPGKEKEKNGLRNYEDIILKPVKPIDTMLNSLVKNKVSYEDLSRFAEIMRVNGDISEKNGFEIIAGMHRIISKALLLIKSRDLMPGRAVVESMRACLIVIVAVVRGKDIDITNYLNKAEDFGKEINAVNI